nr:protein SFI1 homolog [Nomia melanderi]
MKQYFEQFIMHIKESVISKIAQQKAEMFYNMKCMQKGFFAWQKWYYEKLQRTERMNAIKSIFENQRKRSTFDNWCLYIHDKKCRRRKTFSSHNFYKKKLLSRALKSLYNYTIYRKEKQLKLSYLNEKSMMITYYLQNIYIKKWIRSLYIAIQEKRKLHEAIEFWQTNLFRKYFFYWKKFSEKHKTKNIYKNELNKLASDFLLKKYIVHWRDKLQNTLEMKKKEMFIKSIINQRILRKYLSFWKQYILQKAAKRNNIEAAKEMYKKFLLRDGLKKVVKYTLHNIEQKHCLQLENAAIRSFKNFEVLKEYFDKWQSIIYLKNKSKSLHKVISNTDFQLPYSDTSCNIHCGIKNIGLVLPEYMKEEDTISIIPDCVMFPLENRSFNFFQSH